MRDLENACVVTFVATMVLEEESLAEKQHI
jgi:hypothetical protein